MNFLKSKKFYAVNIKVCLTILQPGTKCLSSLPAFHNNFLPQCNRKYLRQIHVLFGDNWTSKFHRNQSNKKLIFSKLLPLFCQPHSHHHPKQQSFHHWHKTKEAFALSNI